MKSYTRIYSGSEKNGMKQTRRNTRWLLWILALLILMIPAASHAVVAVGQSFEGLPDTYYGEPGENWTGTNYLERFYGDDGTYSIRTLGIREINGTRYICVGWKNGEGSIPSSGDTNRVKVTLSQTSSMTWVYKPAHELSIDVTNFNQTVWAWGRTDWGQVGWGGLEGYEVWVSGQAQPTNTGSVPDWISIAAGGYTSYAVRKDGTLWIWGAHSSGQDRCGEFFSFNLTDCTLLPTQFGTETDWQFVTASQLFAAALKTDGTLWVWRSMDNPPVDYAPTTPQPVNTDSDWVAVSAGGAFFLALKKDGTLWSWGGNTRGELGHGSTESVTWPTQVGSDSDWVDISALFLHALALKKDGTLWAWGYNEYGQVGDGSLTNVLAPKQIAPGIKWKSIGKGGSFRSSAAIRDDGTLWTWGNGGALGRSGAIGNPAQIGTDTKWVHVGTGGTIGIGNLDFMIGLKSDGTLWGWGNNDWSQLSLSQSNPVATPIKIYGNDWIDVFTGGEHVLALKSPNRIRYDFSPYFGSRLLPEGDIVTATARVQPFDNDSDYGLPSWNNGFGDIDPDGCLGYVQFDITQDSGLTWQYTQAETVSLTVGLAPGVPSQIGDIEGFNPVIGTYEMAGGCLPLSLSAPAEVVIPGTTDRWVSTGWTATGLTPDSGTSNSIDISNPADIDPEVVIQWIYQLESELPPTLTVHLDQADWPQADVAVSESGTVAGTWTNEQPLTDGDNVLFFEENETVKLSAAFGFVDGEDTYKSIGLTINTPGYSMPIAQNVNGDRIEFVLTIRQSLDVTISYSPADGVSLGSPIPLPPDITPPLNWTDADWKSHILNFEPGNPSDTIDNSFFWDNTNKALYPVRPSPYFKLDWDGLGLGTPYQSVWGPAGQGGLVAGAPVDLQPGTSDYTFVKVNISESYDYEAWVLQDNIFKPLQAGRSLLQFSDKDGNPVFLTVEAVDFVSPLISLPATIGTAISETTHEDPDGKTGYVYKPMALYDGTGEDKAYDRDSREGRIIPVNTESASNPDDDMVIIWYKKGVEDVAATIGWPVTTRRYDCQWPDDPETMKTIVIASGNGSGPLTEHKLAGKVYNQPLLTESGYNPNEEHALILGNALYALRNDLNTYQLPDSTWKGPLKDDQTPTSEPYVLLKYKAPETGQWMMDVYRVEAEDDTHTFTYTVKAGTPIEPVTPMDLLPGSGESAVSSPHESHHEDTKFLHWAKAATQTDEPIVLHWYYPLQSGFYYPDSTVEAGDDIPFLAYHNGGDGDSPTNVSYEVAWPADVPVLKIGETLTGAKYGLPDVASMAHAEIIYNETGPDNAQAKLIAPFAERSVPLLKSDLNANIKTELRDGRLSFPDLPYFINRRLIYDPTAEKLIFRGVEEDTGLGEPLLLPNIMSEREKDIIKGIPGADSAWNGTTTGAVDRLFAATRSASNVSGGPFALTAGMAEDEGYIVLAENDDESLGAAPVQLHVIHVAGGPVRGEIKVIESDNPFDEKLTLRHSNDFGGYPENVYFKWYYKPDSSGIPPRLPIGDPAEKNWVLFGDEGWGLNDITIQGAGKLTLSDNWFIVKYYYGDAYKALVDDDFVTARPSIPSHENDPDVNYWSLPAGSPGGETAQLAEGWIKRVVKNLNPLDARVKDFRNNETNTDVSLVTQLGEKYEGAIALSGAAENLNTIGLIEAYETVLDRGRLFSIDGATPVDYGPANVALLNAATRISGFYTLLGNEAYADAQDPTIAFDSISGEQGIMASSLFAFKNQLDSLLEEELVLLRGRDDTLSTTRARPVYNRLIWNFTNGEGEIAYVQTYNVSDIDTSGIIDELDAKHMYPQGHGDAWGHYLSAMATWYRLLKHPNYTWEPRVESVLVGGAPVPVDYLDERKFAETAAAKARTGAEIVDLTYRKHYTADKAGQWQGYKDTDRDRAWGVDDWARRAGLGALFDWAVANAMLPSVDPNPAHTGIQVIDRTTVPELREIASQGRAVQSQADKADTGLNPLGLADGVVPFDVDPTFLEVGSGMQGMAQFVQIYDRAVIALQNADAAFEFANQYTLLSRANEDDIAVFKREVVEQERDYNNRLIEIFGYPHAGDIGSTGTYPDGYDGPDLFHYMYVDSPELTGLDTLSNNDLRYIKYTFTGFANDYKPFEDGLHGLYETIDVDYPMFIDAPWRYVALPEWGKRRAPGEIQMALSDLISANASYKQGLKELDDILAQIDTAGEILLARYGVSAEQIRMIHKANEGIIALTTVATLLGNVRSVLEFVGDSIAEIAGAVASFNPTVLGIAANDLTSTIRGTIKLAVIPKVVLYGISTGLGVVEENFLNGAEIIALNRDRKMVINDARFEVQQMAKELGVMYYEAEAKILELYTLAEAMTQAAGAFQAALAEGERLISERETFRKFAAGDVQEYRYQDWAFRTFRNDAVQKYRATFNLAARYAYLAATAYDYETNMLATDTAAGQHFLSEIVKRRSPGAMADGVPVAGSGGLSDPLARLEQNFGVYSSQLGINNPQWEDNVFSLRRELFRIREDSESDASWKIALQRARVADLSKFPPFVRYCRKFAPDSTSPQPGIVIPFSTEITFGRNFFGWALGAGDSAFDPTNFTTKIFGAGITLDGYQHAGLSNTPRVYLVPVGADIQRSPSDDNFLVRRWKVVDQKLPAPFAITTADFENSTLIPVNDLLSDEFRAIRKFSSFRAHFDGGEAFNAGEMVLDLRLVGRSAWNTQWLLIIPGGTLLDDPNMGIDLFINNVKDIRLNLSTYAYSGN